MSREPDEDDGDEDLNYCSVPTCPRVIPPTRVMCRRCWDLVPIPTRLEIGEAVLDQDEDALARARIKAVEAVEARG